MRPVVAIAAVMIDNTKTLVIHSLANVEPRTKGSRYMNKNVSISWSLFSNSLTYSRCLWAFSCAYRNRALYKAARKNAPNPIQ